MNDRPSRDDIIRRFPLREHVQSKGIKLRGNGSRKESTSCPGTNHKPDHWCVTIDFDEERWRCFDCQTFGSIIDWIAIEQSKDPKSVMKELSDEISGLRNDQPKYKSKKETPEPEEDWAHLGEEVAYYDYTDENQNLLYQVVRFNPKTFRQRRPNNGGGWIKNIGSTRRVLYNLFDVLMAEEVWVVEGEKDADNLKKIGITATCNVCGAGKWMDAYTETLEGKDIVICGDKDNPGMNHVEKVLQSLSGKVKSTRSVTVPDPHHDISDFIESFSYPEESAIEVTSLMQSFPKLTKGIDIPIYSLMEIQPEYSKFVRDLQDTTLNLSNWLPTLQSKVRAILPGELVVFISDTGVGKTAILSNLAANTNLTTIFFELELPPTLLYERFVASKMQWTCGRVEREYRDGGMDFELSQHELDGLHHIHICPHSRMSIDTMERIITRAELKLDRKPRLILVDYIQLVAGDGKSRYERTSGIAEDLKILAKQTNTIVVVASQIARKKDDASPEVTLHEAKESGSIENSSGLVIGAWRDQDDPSILNLKILKNTKGQSGTVVKCNFDGAKMRITERATIDPSDIPSNSNGHHHNSNGQHNGHPPQPQQELQDYHDQNA